MDIADLMKTSKVLFPGSPGEKSILAEPGEFGIELTNKVSSLSPTVPKRHLDEDDDRDDGFADPKTPGLQKGLVVKRQRLGVVIEEPEWEPPYAPNSKVKV